MNRQWLEQNQVWIYLGAILAGLLLGSRAPVVAGPFETLLWPVLGLLLYATFTQVPLMHLPEAFRDRRLLKGVACAPAVRLPWPQTPTAHR